MNNGFIEVMEEIMRMEKSGAMVETISSFFISEMKRLGWKERIKWLYKVRDKNGKLVPFRPNQEQLEFIEHRKGRDIILKSRQVGYTTLACVYSADRAMWDDWRCGIMAHRQDTVKKIFDIVKDINDAFKKDWGKLYPLEEDKNNVTRLTWTGIVKGELTVAFDFQGYTLNFLHGSEAAFIDSSRLSNSFQAVPENGEICLESTPNGKGGFFYKCWQNHKKFGDNAPYKGFFIPWYKHYPENIERYNYDTGKLSEKEQELINQYKLQNHHINWRREKIRGDFEGNEDNFDAQYPTDDESCFLSGASSVVPRGTLKYQETFIKPYSHIGIFKLNGKNVQFFNDKNGYIKIWELPKPGETYAIGCDPTAGGGKDPAAAVVLKYKTGEIVSILHGSLDPNTFSEELWKLGQFYNQACLCIEENYHGLTVIMKLVSMKYYNLYRREEFDNVSRKMKKTIGFLTTGTTKIVITDNMSIALKLGDIKVTSQEVLNELSTFINVLKKASDGRYVHTNRREAQSDCHDDLVMALALAYEVIRSRPMAKDNEQYQVDHFLKYDPETGAVVGSNEDYYQNNSSYLNSTFYD